MLIRLGYEIGLSCPQETPLVAILGIHPEREFDIRQESGMVTCPPARGRAYFDQFGNRCMRYVAPAGDFTMRYDAVVEDCGQLDEADLTAGEVPIGDLPDETLVYLLASRYCEADLLTDLAWSLFGKTNPGWARAQAICDYVHNRVSFGYGYARQTRTAAQAFEERVGVCRDFAHLAITFCRCMNIPARYVNGYLGDIGVPPDPAPMDFNAWVEVFLGGRWYTFDPRHNRRRIGRVVIARGRDAMDVPMIHTFGPHELKKFKVWTEEYRGDDIHADKARQTKLSLRWHDPVLESASQPAS